MTNEDRFSRTVRAHAEAFADFDFTTVMSYFSPEALAGMAAAFGGPGGPPRPGRMPRPMPIKSFEVLESAAGGDEGSSSVRYVGPKGAGSFVLKQKWRLINDSWRIVLVERPEDLVQPATFLYRIVSRLKAIFTPIPMPPMAGGPGGFNRRPMPGRGRGGPPRM
jgi:hypothetical protein